MAAGQPSTPPAAFRATLTERDWPARPPGEESRPREHVKPHLSPPGRRSLGSRHGATAACPPRRGNWLGPPAEEAPLQLLVPRVGHGPSRTTTARTGRTRAARAVPSSPLAKSTK